MFHLKRLLTIQAGPSYWLQQFQNFIATMNQPDRKFTPTVNTEYRSSCHYCNRTATSRPVCTVGQYVNVHSIDDCTHKKCCYGKFYMQRLTTKHAQIFIKYSRYFVRFRPKFKLFAQSFSIKVRPIPNFTDIRLVGDELRHAGRTPSATNARRIRSSTGPSRREYKRCISGMTVFTAYLGATLSDWLRAPTTTAWPAYCPTI